MPKRTSNHHPAAEEPTSAPTANGATAPAKNPHAVALGRLGGLKGGKISAANMTPEQRSERARKAAQVRWGKKKRKKVH